MFAFSVSESGGRGGGGLLFTEFALYTAADYDKASKMIFLKIIQ